MLGFDVSAAWLTSGPKKDRFPFGAFHMGPHPTACIAHAVQQIDVIDRWIVESGNPQFHPVVAAGLHDQMPLWQVL